MSLAIDPNFSIEAAIRCWVLGDFGAPVDVSQVVQLREIILGIARSHLASGPTFSSSQHLEAEDFAIEFLLNLRKQGNWKIHTKSGLKAEYRRWVSAFCSPAQHELWEILSNALHELSRQNSAWRLDAPASSNNRNDAIWTSVAGTASFDLAAFQKVARSIKSYEPPAARAWHREGSVAPKVISPSDAKKLTLDLLHAAAGSIRFRDLLEEFSRHVFTFSLSGEDNTENRAIPAAIHPPAMQRFHDLAHERVALIWDAVSVSQCTNLLCDYFIPKYLEGCPVILEDFGEPRRVHERLKRMVQIIKEHLDLNVGEALDVDDVAVNSGLRTGFLVDAMHILRGKCACRPGKTATSALPT